MSDYTELKRLAEAFPADLDFDSNTEPFFNGPSGESLGGGATGFYCVYGKPFRLEGEDYDYDGPTYVEACPADFAKFMVAAREGVLALISENEQLRDGANMRAIRSLRGDCSDLLAERDQLKAENDAIRAAYMAAGEREHGLRVERETLRKAVTYAIEMFSRITSGDGSGHADLGRAVLRIAGSAMVQKFHPIERV